MGIICFPCIGRVAKHKYKKVLHIVKLDGKILEFKAPVLVKDILVNFSGSGIGLSEKALEHLPPDYQLKIGKVYYILPSLQPAAVKRIKVVITKQQLQHLLTKQLSVGEVLISVLVKTSDSSIDSPSNWKPKLESIPEGSE